MAPEDRFVLEDKLTEPLAMRDKQNIQFFESHEGIDFHQTLAER
jgi:hypothetical protein